MSHTITDGTTTITPEVIDAYESARPARNVVHKILGSNAPAVSLRQAGLRTGSMRILILTEADSVIAETLLQSGVELTLASTSRSTINMTFVVSGDVTRTLNVPLGVWWVSFEFQETN